MPTAAGFVIPTQMYFKFAFFNSNVVTERVFIGDS